MERCYGILFAPEFNHDKDFYLFKFDPHQQKISNQMCYHSLLRVAEMTLDIIDVWNTQIAEEIDVERKLEEWTTQSGWMLDGEYRIFTNKYQLNADDRKLLKGAAVQQLLLEIGGEEALKKLKVLVKKIIKTAKEAIMKILSDCLPKMPSPAIQLLLSYIKATGIKKIGLRTNDIKTEKGLIKSVHWFLSTIFSHMQNIMFNTCGQFGFPTKLPKWIRKLEESYEKFSTFLRYFEESCLL